MNTNLQPAESAENQASNDISRGDFLRSLGLSTASLMAFYCLGTSLTACKKEEGGSVTPTPSNGITGTTTGSNISFTVDLTNSSVSSLKTGTPLKTGDVFLAKAKSGYIALQRLCTHQAQDQLTYDSLADTVVCTAHGSVFKTDGTVSLGPATTALKRYTTSLSADGNTLTVRA